MTTREVEVHLKELHPTQQEVIEHPARFKVLTCGRRWGKTDTMIDLAVNACLETSRPYAYYADVYRTVSDFWRRLKAVIRPIVVDIRESEKRIECITGATIECWSLSDEMSSVGRAYAGVLIDEASLIPKLQYAWQYTVRPTLTDFEGWAVFGGTPKGFNFFHTLYSYGLDKPLTDWQSWQFPSLANPHIPATEIKAAERELPGLVFQQEYLAEFIPDAGAVFRGVTAVSTAEVAKPYEGNFVMGVDWGRSDDYTVVSVVDRDTGTQVDVDRYNQIGWDLQRGRIIDLYGKWQPQVIIAEENSMGSPNIEALQNEGLPVQPFTTTAKSKTPLIEALALAIERGDITLLNDRVQIAELQAYTMNRLPGGGFRYSAPDGAHDDMVIALALAWHAVVSVHETVVIMI